MAVKHKGEVATALKSLMLTMEAKSQTHGSIKTLRTEQW
jgi:hypothetical protein